ncbi:MAG TPA: hypothetical protein VLB74_10525 [Flavobacterium sp.]|uniref:hypothetical protein n=1 Tax=Flavobacterium sp. TaxID=239 RepID=UPI002C5D5863|nr:hypothetical protein [Flavobacterium sp.]HSD15072.1 hypothetical protein [Flavobacterium sp.]
MRNKIKIVILFVIGILSVSVYSQDKKQGQEPEGLGLPGDGLDLYAVLDVFQKSKTIEAFEKSLNDSQKKINNLDLNKDKKVDFIKVTTKKDGDNFTFVLQVDVKENETQDVAAILLDKDKAGKVTMQIVGDEDLYGKDYIVEPKGGKETPNPGYTGEDPVKTETQQTQQAQQSTTTVVVEQAPIVQYVYSPAYVPYYPPYYYGYYPPYFAAFTVMAFGIYAHNHYHHHHGGYYHNTTVVHNHNTYNNYNGNRNRSNTVNQYNRDGSYRNSGGVSDRTSNRPSAGTSDRGGNRPSAGTNDRGGNRPSAGTSDRGGNRPSAGTSDRGGNRPSAGTSPSTRQSSGYSGSSSRPSTGSSSMGSSGRTRSGGGSYSGGGGFSGGGGGMRGGGGGGGGRRR